MDQDSPCVFTRDLDRLYLPVRHGEGKVVGREPGVIDMLRSFSSGCIVLRVTEVATPTMDYPFNPNGASGGIAGICDPSGRIFGRAAPRMLYR